jgi:hypothetical protein
MNVLDLAFTTAELVVKEIAGDGLQWTDAIKILTSSEFQQKFAEVLAGFSDVPGEIRDLSTFEGLDLAEHALAGAKRVIVSFGRAA